MSPILSKASIACGILLACATAARSQSLAFNILGGYAGRASADGAGSLSRFNNPGGTALDAAGNLYVADTDSHTIRQVTPAGVASTLAGLPGVSGSADGTNGGARFNQPLGVAVDSAGAVYVADTGNHTIRKLTLSGANWIVTTLAGQAGVSGSANGTGTNALFNSPQGIAVDSLGNVSVADTLNHTIRKITSAAVVSTLAGSPGSYGSADGTASGAQFYQPQGLAVDSARNIYVADTGNHTIRKVTAGGVSSTLAGLAGVYGSADGSGTNAQFYQPAAVAVDGLNNVYVADSFNSTLRLLTPLGVVSTLAGAAGNYGSADGTNSAARFRGPQGVAVRGTNNVTVYLADSGNGTIRKIAPAGGNWVVGAWAGSPSGASDDGTGSNARFCGPGAVALGSAGTVYVADSGNNTIRQISPAGIVTTLAGLAGASGTNNGTGPDARFSGPQGIALDGAGNLYVADSGNATIRKVTPDGAVTTFAGAAGVYGSANGSGGNAQFYQPTGIAVDSAGYVYVADTWNHTIRKITPAGAVSTLAGLAGYYGGADGSGPSARFNGPCGLAVDSGGNLYVTELYNHTVRKITPSGTVSTLAGMAGFWGSTDSTNSAARFFKPSGVAVDGAGTVYVMDSGNHTLRKVTLSGTNRVVTTVAGLAGISGSAAGLGGNARFYHPAGVALNSAGLLSVADTGNNTLCLGGYVAGAAPTIFIQPQSLSVNPGSTVTFGVAAGGAPPLSYQWRRNASDIAGATDSSLARTNVQAGDLGSYSVVITNALGGVTSSNAILALNAAPIITSQPQPQTVLAGRSAGFIVVAAGTAPLSYQWRWNGTNLPGATASAFNLAAASTANRGFYSVTITNSVGFAVSSDALLTVTELDAWGDNSMDQLNVPSDAVDVIAIAAGAWHNVALRADGTVLAWGDGSVGQTNVPPALADVLAIAAGGYHSLAIQSDGTVTAWGANDSNQTNVPFGLNSVIGIGAGTWHSLALRRDGTLAAWGDNGWGQGSIPAALSNIVAIAAGGNHNLALRGDGTVAAWGENTDAQGAFSGQSVVPPGLTNVIALAAGEYHSLALRADGTVVAWGDNSQGQCDVPAGLSNVVALAGGGAHTLALKADGTVAAWGANWNGQCSPAAPLMDITALAAGELHSLALAVGRLPVPLAWSPAVRTGRFDTLVQTLNRKHYALEYSDTLAATNWNSATNTPGNGALKLLADPAATAPQRFYRVRQW